MTPEQYEKAQAVLAAAEAEMADCRRQEQDCIAKAREQNDIRRTFESKRIGLEQQTLPIRQECERFVLEMRNAQLAKMQADVKAAEDKKAEEAAKAEQTELEKLRAKVAELEAKLPQE